MQVKSFDKCMAFHGNFSTLSKKNHGKTKIYKEHSPMVTFYNFSTKYTHKSLETASSIYHVWIIFRKTNISYPLIRTRMSAYQGVRNLSLGKCCVRTRGIIPTWILESSKKCGFELTTSFTFWKKATDYYKNELMLARNELFRKKLAGFGKLAVTQKAPTDVSHLFTW